MPTCLSTFACGLALTVACLSAAMAAESPPLLDGRYITQRMIDTEGGVPFVVPKVGRFTLQKVELTRDPAAECRISVESLSQIIEKGVADGTMELSLFGKKKIRLEAHHSERGPYCAGLGRGCVATVNVDRLADQPESTL